MTLNIDFAHENIELILYDELSKDLQSSNGSSIN